VRNSWGERYDPPFFTPDIEVIGDATLAVADEITLNNAATSLVAAAEQLLALHPEYAKLQAISVAALSYTPPDGTRGRLTLMQTDASAIVHL
jgi:hypothetical protein